MYSLKHFLAELNLDHADIAVAQFTSMLSHITNPSEIYFTHVKDHLHAREELPMDDDILLPTQVEVAEEKIIKTLKKHFKGNVDTRTELLIKEGNQLKFLLKQIKEHEIDLMIVGREPQSESSRKLPVKLARKAPCSILIVPEDSEPVITTIIVPIDFSHHAKLAVEEAISMAIANKIEKITLLHLFKLPSGYTKTGKDEDEFCAILKKNAEEEYEYFMEDIDMKGIDATLHLGHDEHLAHGILEEIRNQRGDLVIVGARGRSTGASIFLGSVTEDLIAKCHVPILAVKDKKKGMSFYESILKL